MCLLVFVVFVVVNMLSPTGHSERTCVQLSGQARSLSYQQQQHQQQRLHQPRLTTQPAAATGTTRAATMARAMITGNIEHIKHAISCQHSMSWLPLKAAGNEDDFEDGIIEFRFRVCKLEQ